MAKGEHRTARMVTALDGAFAFSGLRRGSYEVTAKLGTKEALAKADLLPRTPSSLELNLTELAVLTGTVRDEKGAPLAGAAIEGSQDEQERAATSGNDGRYVLRLPAGSWDVVASASGHLESRPATLHLSAVEASTYDFALQPSSVLSGFVRDSSGNPISNAWVRPRSKEGTHLNDARTDTDGAFRLELVAGAYEVQVSHTKYRRHATTANAPASGLEIRLDQGGVVTGIVQDASGDPIETAHVEAHHESAGARFASSDADGRFDFGGLETGRYRVSATARQDGVVVRTSTVEIEVDELQPSDVVLRVPTGKDIAGVLVDSDNTPLAGIEISASHTGADRKTERRGAHLFTRSGPDGRFTLSNATAEQYSLRADAKRVRQQAPTLAKPGDRDVKIVASRRATVTGRVLGSKGQPLGSFQVDLHSIEAVDGVFHHPVDEDFVSPLAISAEGHATREIPVEVRVGAEINLGDIVLDAGRTVRGRVVDGDTGAPVVGAHVLADPGAGPNNLALLARYETDLAVPTSRGGQFVLEHVPARDTLVAVTHPEYGTSVETIRASDLAPTIRISRGATVRGRVLSADGRGVSTKVRAISVTARKAEQTDSDASGSFRFASLEPGKWQFRAEAFPVEGVMVAVDPVEEVVPKTGEVSVELRARTGGATLHVRLLAPGGARASAMSMLYEGVLDHEAMANGPPLTNLVEPTRFEEGNQSFTSLAAGRYTLLVIARAPSGEAQYLLHPLDVSGQGTRTLDLTLDPSALRAISMGGR